MFRVPYLLERLILIQKNNINQNSKGEYVLCRRNDLDQSIKLIDEIKTELLKKGGDLYG